MGSGGAGDVEDPMDGALGPQGGEINLGLAVEFECDLVAPRRAVRHVSPAQTAPPGQERFADSLGGRGPLRQSRV